MKYLKKIFEQINIDELKDFCESNLIYLIDEGFMIEFIDDQDSELYKMAASFKKKLARMSIRLNKYDKKYFNWNDIKDYYIPFLIRLSKEYKTYDKCLIIFHYGGTQLISYDELMKGKFNLNKELKSISIKVYEKL
jgi:hypothetical protein